jgi:Major tropism determinant N-terminal domain
MPLQLRRGTDNGRLSITPVTGELIYVTDTKQVFVGDGTTVGGIPIGGGGAGYVGSRGLLGYTGSAVTGPLGYTGSAGPGFTGSTGAMGYTGSVGTGTGAVGYAGSRGYSGSTGYTGSAGLGFTGSTGAQGLTGYAGSAGTGGGISGVSIWDEDLLVGTFANLNFVGASVVASTQSTSSGGYAAITISAGTGTGAIGYTGSAGLGFTGYTGSAGTGGTGTTAIKTFSFKTTQTASDIVPSYSIDGLDIARDPIYYPVRNPEITLVRGQTYRFDLTNVPSTFPWVLSLYTTSTTAVPGTIGNDIISGVAGNKTTSTIVTYTVPFDAPSKLFYKNTGTNNNGIIKIVDNYFPTNSNTGQTIFPNGISSPMIYDDINLRSKASTSTFSLLSQTFWEWNMGGGVYSQPNVITYDLTSGTIFSQIISTGTVATNWIANFTNVPSVGVTRAWLTTALGNGISANSSNAITRVKLILKQYSAATRIPTQIWVNNTNTYVSVYWKNGVTPASINTSTARQSNNNPAFDQCIDILTFDIMPDAVGSTVLASIENYSQIPGYTRPNWPNL